MKTFIRVGFAILFISMALLLYFVHNPVQASSFVSPINVTAQKELCSVMASIAGTAAAVTQQQPELKGELRKFVGQIAQKNGFDVAQTAQAFAAMDFGITMAPSYPPAVIAKYQYYGCMATT